MLNKKLQAARAIKGDLIPTETSIDIALGHLGQLISTACKARLDTGVPVHFGHEAMGHLTAATAMMGELRNRVILAHACLANDRAAILPTIGFGDTTQCPAQGSAEAPAQSGSLRVVA